MQISVKPTLDDVDKTADALQDALTAYAYGLNYDVISREAIQTAKARVVDTLGALLCGYFAEPCRIARKIASKMPLPAGATIIGTRMKTTPDIAAYVNAITARYVEMTDVYHWGHPSDVIMPLLAVAEYMRTSGRDFLAGIVLGYEVYQTVADVFKNKGYDNTNFCCLGTAVAAGKLLHLSPTQLAQCISIAAVSNNVLRQVRLGEQSMFKTVATGYAERAGVFAALLAGQGMEGPHLPFQGKGGWCAHVAGGNISLASLGGERGHLRILDTRIKMRSSVGTTISSVLAAEKIAPLPNIADVHQVVVEVYKRAKETVGTGAHVWNPQSRETADHSIPFVVAVTLIDGTVTPRSFNAAHLRDTTLRALMQKIDVVENAEFTRANERQPAEYRTRVTVTTRGGQLLIGESDGDHDAVSAVYTDEQIAAKFRGYAEELLGRKRADAILDRLWSLETSSSVADIPPAFVLG